LWKPDLLKPATSSLLFFIFICSAFPDHGGGHRRAGAVAEVEPEAVGSGIFSDA